MSLADAIEAIISVHGDPVLVARGCIVDADEVAAALAAAQPDTAEAYALKMLAELNPCTPKPKASK